MLISPEIFYTCKLLDHHINYYVNSLYHIATKNSEEKEKRQANLISLIKELSGEASTSKKIQESVTGKPYNSSDEPYDYFLYPHLEKFYHLAIKKRNFNEDRIDFFKMYEKKSPKKALKVYKNHIASITSSPEVLNKYCVEQYIINNIIPASFLLNEITITLFLNDEKYDVLKYIFSKITNETQRKSKLFLFTNLIIKDLIYSTKNISFLASIIIEVGNKLEISEILNEMINFQIKEKKSKWSYINTMINEQDDKINKIKLDLKISLEELWLKKYFVNEGNSENKKQRKRL